MPSPTLLSVHHSKVERLRRLGQRRSLRATERACVLEGAKVIDEALRAGAAIEAVFVDAAADHLGPLLVRAYDAGVRVHHLGPGVVERVAGTVTPQPVLAIAPWPDVALDEVLGATFVVVCADLRDPGNAGTVLRSAEAAGAGAVVFCDGSVDVFNPKTVRSSAGSLFHVPVVAGGEPAEVIERLRDAGLHCLGTAARTGRAYDDVDLLGPTALVLGNEAWGLPGGLAGALDEVVHIPMAGRSESLNVGMAAAVVCFEALRQRRRAGVTPSIELVAGAPPSALGGP